MGKFVYFDVSVVTVNFGRIWPFRDKKKWNKYWTKSDEVFNHVPKCAMFNMNHVAITSAQNSGGCKMVREKDHDEHIVHTKKCLSQCPNPV